MHDGKYLRGIDYEDFHQPFSPVSFLFKADSVHLGFPHALDVMGERFEAGFEVV